MRKLVFRKPAMSWDTSLPAGNGKTAFVVSGGERIEILWFNDAELWSGYPKDHDNDGARSALKEVRELIFQGKTSEADAFVKSRLDGDYSEAFMPLATVKIRIIAPTGAGYRRELDFNDGMISVEDDLVKRRAFVSYPHKTAVYSVESKIKFSLDVSAKSVLHYVAEVRNGVLTVSGNAPDYAAPNYLRTKLFPVRYNEKKASAFCLALRAETDGEIKDNGKKLSIRRATYVRIYAVTETGFRGYDKMPCTDTATVRNKAIEELAGIDATYEEIEKAHVCDYRALYGRQKLTLAEGDGDVEKLLKKARYGNAPAELINLLYDFGIKLGLAFQLQDDYLDVYADSSVFGKNIGGDICSNKKTFMLITALEKSSGENKKELENWINAEAFIPEEKIKAVTEIYNNTGVPDICMDKINTLYNEGLAILDNVSVDASLKTNLKNFTKQLMKRVL